MSIFFSGVNIDHELIHTGGWTNWNDGYLNGGRITLTKTHSELIMIFAGILLVFIEAGVCSLVAFSLFLYHARANPSSPEGRKADALWHQRQTALRNSGDFRAIMGTYTSLWLAYGWKKPIVALQTLPTTLVALLFTGLFLVALPFLTAFFLLDEQGNEMLLRSPNCKTYNSTYQISKPGRSDVELSSQWTTAAQYVDSCYTNSYASDHCDNFLVQRRLEWNSTEAECPFDRTICLGNATVQMKTKLLDSHKDLGLNAPRDGRVGFRRITTCSPVDVQARTNITKGALGDEVTYVYFGSFQGRNVTYFTSSWQQNITRQRDYNLIGYSPGPVWQPIKELNRTNATPSIVFFNNNGIRIRGTSGPCKDPFFSASINETDTLGAYSPDNPITAIACADQYQFHNPVNGASSEPSRYIWGDNAITKMLKNTAAELELNKKQDAVLGLLLHSLNRAGTIGELLFSLQTNVMLARKNPGVNGIVQNPIPDDQWKNETGHWFNTGLAALQLQFVWHARGPTNVTGLEIQSRNETQDSLCSMQKIRHTGFRNFRRPGFVALAAVGGFLIFGPWLLIRAVVWYGRRRRWPLVMEWISYRDQQLLRMANEGAGVEGWEGCDEEIPFIKGNGIASVDIGAGGGVEKGESGRKLHPRMRYSPRKTVENSGSSIANQGARFNWQSPGQEVRESESDRSVERDRLLRDGHANSR